MNSKRLSISMRFMLLFCLLLLPIMILGTVIIDSNATKLQESILEVVQGSMEYQRDMMENHVQTMQNSMMAMMELDSGDVMAFLAKNENLSYADYYIMIRKIAKSLRNLSAQNGLFSGIEVLYPTLSLSIDSNVGLHYRDSAYFQPYIDEAMQRGIGLRQIEEKLCILYTMPKVIANASETQAVLAAEISDAVLQKLLRDSPLEGRRMTLERGGEILFSTADIQADENAWTFCVESKILGCSLYAYVPREYLFRTSDQLQGMLIIYLLCTIPLFLLYCIFTKRMLQSPVRNLLRGMEEVQAGKLDCIIQSKPSSGEFARLTEGFNAMTERLNELIQKTYRQEINVKQLELKYLQTQIAPHFLFNTLYTLRQMIECEDTEKAIVLSGYLRDYFHYLANADHMNISMAEEYAQAKNYLDIQHMRFPRSVLPEFDVLPKAWEGIFVPKLIIQPLYENAIKYSGRSEEKPLHIRTTFSGSGECGIIRVEDNGCSLTDAALEELAVQVQSGKESENISALSNIRKRLELQYGSAYALRLMRSSLGGLAVEIYIPLKEAKTP